MQADPARPPAPAWARARELGTVRVLALCALVILLEGFDLQAAGVSAPHLAPEFHLLPVQIGWFLGASSLGIFLASVLGGILADRFGRRPVVVAGVALFGCCSLLTLRAGGFGPLLAARFMTGMGLGLAMPAVIAMASDHSPAEWKKRAVGFIYCAIPLGALLAGAVIQSGWFGQGWRSVYLVGGLAPILAAPLLLALLPAANGGGPRAERPGRFLGGLLGGEHARVTLALWLGTFGTLLVIYLLLGWMPTLLVGLGLQRGQVQFIQMAFNLGASLSAALCLAPLGYGRAVRTIGVGATVSAGRFGTVAGPLLAGSLLSVGKSAADVLIVLIPITLLSGLAVLLVTRWSAGTAVNSRA
jgi:MFS transporter, AAHS family, 3-hydroxyphenylpropionic acid transporter